MDPTRERPRSALTRRARIAAQAAAAGAGEARLPPLRLGVLRLERPAVLQAVPAPRRRPRGRLRVRCFGVSGCAPRERGPAGRGRVHRAALSQRAKRMPRGGALARRADAAGVQRPPGRRAGARQPRRSRRRRARLDACSGSRRRPPQLEPRARRTCSSAVTSPPSTPKCPVRARRRVPSAGCADVADDGPARVARRTPRGRRSPSRAAARSRSPVEPLAEAPSPGTGSSIRVADASGDDALARAARRGRPPRRGSPSRSASRRRPGRRRSRGRAAAARGGGSRAAARRARAPARSSCWSAPLAAISIMCTYCWKAPSR